MAAAAADPRRVLIEATALEGIVTLGMNPRAAITAAQGFVQGLTDNQVKLTLDAGPTRGWIMRADGSLDPEATAAAIKAKAEPAAPKAEAPAAASPASTAPADPLRGVVAQMAAQAGKLQQQAPDLAKTIASLDASLSSPDALRHEGLRTRTAWAIMDYERSTGTNSALPEDLRREMEERMVSYPGLRNPRAQAMLRETAAMSSVDLVRQVRRVVCNIAKARPGHSEIADQLQNARYPDPGDERCGSTGEAGRGAGGSHPGHAPGQGRPRGRGRQHGCGLARPGRPGRGQDGCRGQAGQWSKGRG